MSRLTRGWKSERPPLEKLNLGFASYNAGFGNILKAQKNCGMVLLWEDIKICLHLVTGRHAAETKTYVERIHRWYGHINDVETVNNINTP
jgi:membrane-bound lytic murein transglycosylase F